MPDPTPPPGFIPAGGIPGPEPGTYIIPGTPAQDSAPGFPGRGTVTPATPDQGPFPIPGWTPGMETPPVGSIPGPTPGTYIIPGSPGTSGDYRGVGATPATPDQGPFPIPGFQPGPGGMPGQAPGQAPGQVPLPGDYGPPIPGSLPAVMGAGQQMLGAFGQIPQESDFQEGTELYNQVYDLLSAPTGTTPFAIGPVSTNVGGFLGTDQFNQAAAAAGKHVAQPFVEQFGQAAGQFGNQLMQGITPEVTTQPGFFGLPGMPMVTGAPPLMQSLPTLGDIGNMIFGPVPGQVGQAVMNPSMPPAPAMPSNIPPMFPTSMPPAPPLPTTFP